MIPLSILFIPYFICLALLVFFAVVDLFQVMWWSTNTIGAILISAVFLGVAGCILMLTYQSMGTINWTQTLPIFQSFSPSTF